ncbi:MAG TPA: GNAT family N-acetyltransferase [Cyclobacteriaceae bacterium]|nr:GNAT family N-acetyltransferase [Cyclobacteriaceae bacterium]
MKYNIRQATNNDKEKIAALIKEVLAEFNLEYDELTSDEDLVDIEKSYTRNGGIFLILEAEGGDVIGTTALYRESENDCQLRKMYLNNRYRGQGLGKKLMDEILRKAGEMKFKRITLETNAGMTAAIRLYEQYGFKKDDDAVISSPRCNVVMTKIYGNT